MSAVLLVLVPLLPLLLAAVARPRWLIAVAALPALSVALLLPVGSTADLPWVLLGVQLAIDETARLFLLFSALVWLVATLQLAANVEPGVATARFRVPFLLAMSGNFLLILAADMVSFYVGFALMGLSAYALLLRRSQTARRAARVYLAFTLVGELALFAAMVQLYAVTGSLLLSDLAGITLPDAAVALLILGFGIKVALPGLHVWLPPAYLAGPALAVAVLSGPMMKAGLLGWLRFLPPGEPGFATWGSVLLVLGTVGVVLGIVFGVVQRAPRAVAAYSSVAKMGLISALFGWALAEPESSAVLVPALVLFALHHMLVKSSLFFALGEWERSGARAGTVTALVLLAASLAGLPWTGGAAAKEALGAALGDQLGALAVVAALGTTLLMLRLAWLLWNTRGAAAPSHAGVHWSWFLLMPFALWAPFAPATAGPTPGGLLTVLLAGALAVAAHATLARYPVRLRIPPGDIGCWLTRLRVAVPHIVRRPGSGGWQWSGPARRPGAPAPPRTANLLTAGLGWFAVMAGLLLALLPAA